MTLQERSDQVYKQLNELHEQTKIHDARCDCDLCVQFEELTHEKVIIDSELRKVSANKQEREVDNVKTPKSSKKQRDKVDEKMSKLFATVDVKNAKAIAAHIEKLRDEVEPVYIENAKLLAENERLLKQISDMDQGLDVDNPQVESDAMYLLHILDEHSSIVSAMEDYVTSCVRDNKWDEVERVAKAIQVVFE